MEVGLRAGIYLKSLDDAGPGVSENSGRYDFQVIERKLRCFPRYLPRGLAGFPPGCPGLFWS